MKVLPFEQKMRLKFNQISISKSYEEFSKAINTLENQELYTSISELLLWIVTTDEWHVKNGLSDYKKRRKDDENGVILLGMRHAFNMMKHNMSFFQIHQKEGGFEFPSSFPLEITEITVHWMPAGDILVGEYKNQKENYISYLEGEEIRITFNKAIKFLNQEFQKIIF